MNPPVPQPQFKYSPGSGDGPMIGEVSAGTSTMPAHCLQHLQLPERRKHLQEPRNDRLLHRWIAALGIGRHAIDAAADDHLALVGLADIGAVAGVEQHRIETRLDRFGHHRLQRIDMQRQLEPGLFRQNARMPGDRQRQPIGADGAAIGLDARAAAALGEKRLDLAILNNIDTEAVGRARVAPGDRIVPGDAGAALPDAAEHRIARLIAGIEQRRFFEDLRPRHQFGISAVDLHRVDGPRRDLHLGVGVRDCRHAALREHDVVIQLFRQALIEPQREIIERDTLG